MKTAPDPVTLSVLDNRFRAIVAPLGLPLFPVPGNHDSSGGLLKAFPEIAARCAGGRVNYVVEDFPLRLVMLDSTVYGRPHGTLGEEGLADYGALPKADSGAKFEGEIAGYPVKDFYLTNPIARASDVMQQCSDELLHGADVKEAAE